MVLRRTLSKLTLLASSLKAFDGSLSRVVAEALSRNGLTGKQHPRDYLNFYCLGNRQDTVGPDGGPAEQPTKHGRRKPRRSFIHVHAKVGTTPFFE